MHRSVYLNEKADWLAMHAHEDVDAAPYSFERQENKDELWFYRANGNNDPTQAEVQELTAHLVQLRQKLLTQCRKVTRTVQKLTAAGTGQNFLSQVLWSSGKYSVDDRTTRCMLQCITN